MKKLLLFLLALAGSLYNAPDIFAQGENNIWAFGDSTGLDFNSGAPSVIPTHIRAMESCGTICDANGRLLFYCGSPDMISSGLWDATHTLMPNGSGLLGNKYSSSMQGVAIVPFLDGSNRYYVFIQSSGPEIITGDHYLRYSVVDMDLRSGLGDVVPGQKNIIIDSVVTEKLALSIGTGCSVWLINHRSDTNVFHAFKIDVSGLHTMPVVSGFLSDHATAIASPYMFGCIEVSLDGSRLVSSNVSSPYSTIELYDFNKNTGTVSNRSILDTLYNPWIQLSPDGSKLYAGTPVSQYNLALLPSLSAARASRTILDDTVYFTSMRIAPDGKMYSACGFDRLWGIELHLYTINDPDKAAPACGLSGFAKLKDNAHVLGLGLRNIIPPPSDTITSRRDTSLCFTPHALLQADSGFNAYTWNTGTKGRHLAVTGPGKSWVTMRKGCILYVDTFDYRARALDTTQTATDTTLCFSRPVAIKASEAGFYKWQDGDTARTRTFTAAGVYWYASFPSDCAIRFDSFRIHHTPYDTTVSVQKLILCPGVGIQVNARAGYDSYRWYDGSTADQNTLTYPGRYWAVGIKDCSLHIDSFIVEAKPTSFSYFSHDTTLCFEQAYTAMAEPGYTVYLWSDGTTGPANRFTDGGTKWVLSATADCIARIDTFMATMISFNGKLPPADSFCSGGSLVLDAAADTTARYEWQDGNANPVYTITKPGIYELATSVGPCILRQSITVTEQSLAADLGDDRTMCKGEELTLQAAPGMDDYLWNDGSKQTYLSVQQEGVYTVRIQNGHCTATDTVAVTVVACNDCIHIPNAFTPNNDAKNDYFKPLLHCSVQHYELKIYNRYGQEIFNTQNPSDPWDGSFLGKEEEVGVYYFLLKVTFNTPGAKEELYKGDLSLLR